jgi:rhodanese-related sulfurtransferase
MKFYQKTAIAFISCLVISSWSLAQEIPSLDSRAAFQRMEKSDTYLIDVRTIAEYVYVGHPVSAFSIPLVFWDEEGIRTVSNVRFEEDLKGLFKPQDTLIFICRSGNRSQEAAYLAWRVGFKKVFNVSDGFEGGKDNQGLRTINGWKNKGLSYTHTVHPGLMYKFR